MIHIRLYKVRIEYLCLLYIISKSWFTCFITIIVDNNILDFSSQISYSSEKWSKFFIKIYCKNGIILTIDRNLVIHKYQNRSQIPNMDNQSSHESLWVHVFCTLIFLRNPWENLISYFESIRNPLWKLFSIIISILFTHTRVHH